ERLAGVGVPAFGDPDKLRRMAHLLAALEAAVTGDWQCADAKILADTDCERVRALIRQVEENPAMPLSLSEAAARTGFSVPHFCRLFKAATGGSWGAFVTRTRIARAQTLLKLPGAQVKRVAAAVGIEDASYFRKVFFKQTGTTVETFLRGQGGGQ
nr:helix-turn-helix transcriptional regulator [Clostridia bacterium]